MNPTNIPAENPPTHKRGRPLERVGMVYQRKGIAGKSSASVERLKNRPLLMQEKEVVASVQAPPPESGEIEKAIAEQQAREAEERRAELEKEAARSRANRKIRADKIAAIKKALKTPIAEIKAAAEAREKAIKRPGSMNAGRFMAGAPTGTGELVTGGYGAGKIESVTAARDRSAALQSPSHDEDEAFWPENDRRRIKAEGTSSAVDERELEAAPGASGDDKADQAAPSRFHVKLSNFDYYSMLEEMFGTYFVKVLSDKGCSFVCRLCGASFDYERYSKWHIRSVHGDELDPLHDERFGNVLLLYINEKKKRDRKQARLEKAGRENAIAVATDARSRAEIGAAKAGYVKLNGEWIPRPRTL